MNNNKRLLAVYIAGIVLALIIAALYECNILLEGGLCGNTNAEFLTEMVMIMLTICVIPFALRLFKYKSVQNIIRRDPQQGYFRMALLRMLMLIVPMLANVICYYLFVNVRFFYLAVILAISLVFITPTKARQEAETTLNLTI